MRNDADRLDVLVPMTADVFALFLPSAIAGYARQSVAAGRWPEAHALELSRAEHERMLSAGLATPGAHLYEIRDPADGATVGSLWLAVQTAGGRSTGYVVNIEVDEAHRRRGFARRAFADLETIGRGLDLVSLGLNVFAFNTGARALYEGLGYEVSGLTLRKSLQR